MRVKCLRKVSVTFALTFMLGVFLTGCKEQKPDDETNAYYVISEELDFTKTADKAQEILQKTE